MFSIRKIFLILLSLAYLSLGCFLLIKKVFNEWPYDLALGILFLMYGSWRLYRALYLDV